MSLLAALLSIAVLHDGPDPVAAWDFMPRYVHGETLKARSGFDGKIIGRIEEANSALGKYLQFDGREDYILLAENFRDKIESLPREKMTAEA